MRAAVLATTLALTLLLPGFALAGAVFQVEDDVKFDLGFRVQTLYRYTDFEDISTGEERTSHDFLLRRGRLRLGGDITKWVTFFLQTEVTAGAGLGGDVRLIDAYVAVKPHQWAQVFLGENMAPAGRQITTSSGGFLGIDRHAITNFNLTWGVNARPQFNTANFGDSNLDLEGEVNVRDLGATLFGSGSLAPKVHLKYYLGAYEGVHEDDDLQDSLRFTGRVQLNLFEPEPGYYNLGTYLGGKKTVGVGLSHDRQVDVASDDLLGGIQYRWWSADLFADYPVGPGFVTFETVYQSLDLDDASLLDDDGDPASPSVDARKTQGDGYAIQLGYFLPKVKLQPWAKFETWDSDATDGTGSFDLWKVGLTYAIKGHNAKVSAGYERFISQQTIGGTNEDTVNTFVVGFYVTY